MEDPTSNTPEDSTLPSDSLQPDPPALVPDHPAPITAPLPAPTTPLTPSQASRQAQPKRSNTLLRPLLLLIVVLGLLAGTAFAAYSTGKKSTKTATAMPQPATMAVPQGATIIEQCQPGLGTQYVLPKDIPNGPVYNVYQGKLIGTEYMVSAKSLQTLNTSINNLPLFSQTYDHVNIMSMPAHAGFPEAHYQVDVMIVPKSISDKITCSTSSSSPSSMQMQ